MVAAEDDITSKLSTTCYYVSSLQGYLSAAPRWDAGTEGPVPDQGVACRGLQMHLEVPRYRRTTRDDYG